MTLTKEKLVALYSLYKEHHFEKVIQQGEALLEKYPNDITLMKILSASNISLGRFDLAIQYYKKAIKLNPTDAEAYNNIGVAYKEKGDFSEAIKNYQKAINHNPSYAEAYLNLGTVLQEQKNHKAAIKIYQRAIELTPKNPKLHNNLGASYKEENNFSDAISSYQDAIELNPDYAEAHSNLGSVLVKEGYIKKALERFKHAVQLNPNDATIHYNLATTLADNKDTDAAIESYQRAIKLRPTVHIFHFSLGVIFLEKGDTKAALKSLYKVLEINPKFTRAYYPIGLVYYKLKNYAEALSAFDKFDDEESFIQSLLCLHALGRHDEFTERLKNNSDKYKINLEVAALCAFVYDQINEENTHSFCKKPLDLIYFSSLDYHEENPKKFTAELLEELKQEPNVWEPRKRATRNGFHTTTNLFRKSSGSVLGLENIIRNEIELYYNKFKSTKCGFIEFWPKKISLYGWSITNHKGGFQTPHIHPSGWLSGVIYLQLVESENKDEGAIEFSLRGENYTAINENVPTFRYKPNTGDIVFFPSSLFHYTIPIKNEGERIIISFDLLPD